MAITFTTFTTTTGLKKSYYSYSYPGRELQDNSALGYELNKNMLTKYEMNVCTIILKGNSI